MTSLRVRVRANLYEDDTRAGVRVVGNIYPADGRGESHRQVLIPVGSAVEPAEFPVPPGRYVVEATLPSGDSLTDEVEVGSIEPAEVVLEALGSPYETHTWQYLAGNIEPARTYYDPAGIPVPNSVGSRSFERLYAEEDDVAFESVPVPATVRVRFLLDGSGAAPSFEALNTLCAEQSPTPVRERLEASMTVAAARELQPSVDDERVSLFRLTSAGIAPDQTPDQRAFLAVEASGDFHLVTLPCPWLDQSFTEVPVEVMVNFRQSPTGSAISLVVRDAALGTGLSYLAGGGLAKAAAVFRDAQAMLHGGVYNRMAAIAGAYALVGTDLERQPQEWDRWLDDLRERFPSLGDGSVLWAIRHLRLARTPRDVEAAKDALLEAYDRGVPAFTLGISLLVEGLSEFPDDPECVRRVQEVRRLAHRVDMREPFVIVRLGEVSS